MSLNLYLEGYLAIKEASPVHEKLTDSAAESPLYGNFRRIGQKDNSAELNLATIRYPTASPVSGLFADLACFIILRTVSETMAPFEIHSSILSLFKLSPVVLFLGSNVPSTSRNRPSLGKLESAATTR